MIDLTIEPLRVRGDELRIGDTLNMGERKRWRIDSLRPYTGPLAHLWAKGAQIATFVEWPIGMTIDNSNFYPVISRAKVDTARLRAGMLAAFDAEIAASNRPPEEVEIERARLMRVIAATFGEDVYATDHAAV